MQPWIIKYLPKTINEVENQADSIEKLKDYILNFRKQKKKAMIIYGPSGVGKTSSVFAMAKDMNYEILEMNSSDFRNKEKVETVIGTASKQRSLFSLGKILLIDEIDALSGTKDRGGIQALTKIISESSFPIVMTAADPYIEKLAPLRKVSSLAEFKPLQYSSIFNVLMRVCQSEKISYDENSLKSLSRKAGGDCRAAINDLQTLSQSGDFKLEDLGEREKTQTMFNALVKIFKNSNPTIAIAALDNVEEDIDKVFLWIDENLPKEYEGEDLVRAYDVLSKADVFKGRIRRWQHWRFLVYINSALTAGIATAKTEKKKEFIAYAPTKRLLKLWQANMKYQKRKAIAAKIADKTHTSARVVVQATIPYVQNIFRKNKRMAAELSEYFELDKEEGEWLGKG